MAKEFWLSLTEYSAKHGVSISTLRRRIKKDEIPYVLDGGKYVLPDKPFGELTSSKSSSAPPQTELRSTERKQPVTTSFLEPIGLDVTIEEDEDVIPGPLREHLPVLEEEDPNTLPVKASAVSQQAVEEIKKAYALVLKDKEVLITQLRQHVVDLQTLNKALENEVDRLSAENSSMEDFGKETFFKSPF